MPRRNRRLLSSALLPPALLQGQLVSVTETTRVEAPLTIGLAAEVGDDGPGDSAGIGLPLPPGQLMVQSVEDHTARAEGQLLQLRAELPRRPDLPPLRIPQLRMTPVKSDFSLADITDLDPFCKLGQHFAGDPTGNLRRVTLSARVVQGPDRLRHTELVTARAVDRVESPVSLFPLADLRQQLLDQVLTAAVVPARPNQRRPASETVEAFLRGLSGQAEAILSAYMDRAAAGLIQLVTEEQRKFGTRPSYGEVVDLIAFVPLRIGCPETSNDRFSVFERGVGYEGYRKSLYVQDWFDSSTERDVANVLEDEDAVTLWVRLQTGDLPILWTGAREYNPDFIAVDCDSAHWLIEVKMNKEVASVDVQGKREAARRWANYVSADDRVDTTWRYLLVSEDDVKTAKGSWEALKGLGEC